ncbi:MAG: LysR family transcriptional regulator [Mucilaginibacter polytrichastri]|nr:LysR family transcriptional regulator [Mucilaginibacter polytrichastri]
MTLTQLEYAIALDTYRSFVMAAEKCFVTQPTLSMQVQKLEEELGVKLFDRSRQPVTPTETGAEILAQARVIIYEARKIQEIVQDQRGELSGELKIGIIPTVAPYLLPKIVHPFAEKYPQVKLTVWEITTEQIIQQIKMGMIDCGILSTPLDDGQIQEIPLFYENFVAYAAKSSALFKKKQIHPTDIDPSEMWLLNEGHCMRHQVLNICHQKKHSQNGAQFEYNTGSIDTLKRMVDTNGGFTVLPELALSDFSDKQLERIRYFKSPEPAREISLVTNKNFLKKRLIESLSAEILEALPKRLRSKKKKTLMEIR